MTENNTVEIDFFSSIEFSGVIIKRNNLSLLIRLNKPIYDIPIEYVKKSNCYNFYDYNSDLLSITVSEEIYENIILGEEIFKTKNTYNVVTFREEINLLSF